jgi:hypothetical protein
MTFVSGLQSVSSRFVFDARVGARVLGLSGTSGVGKTTLSKALCDYFFGEFLGRVCYVDVGVASRMGVGWHAERNEASRLGRVKLILERLCGFDKDALRKITDSRQVIFVSSILTSLHGCFFLHPSDFGATSYCSNHRPSIAKYLKIAFS